MRKSRVLEKLRKGLPVICGKANIFSPWTTEIVGMVGYDCIWLCMEHGPEDYASVENCIRAGKIHDMDIMVRIAKASYSDIIRPLELDAAGVMYPHCKSVEEAENLVANAKFHPVGLRPVDGGNIDGEYCTIPMGDYMKQSNENKFLMVQIEDKEAIEHIESIVKTNGIEGFFVGPADLSQSLGIPGQTNDAQIKDVIKKVADACEKHGKWWGLPVTKDTIRTYYDMGARFFGTGADVVALHSYFKNNLEEVLSELP